MTLLMAADCSLEHRSHIISFFIRAALHLAASAFMLTPPGIAQAEPGRWTANSSFAQINVFCQRLYTCSPASDIVYDAKKKLVVSAPTTVRGVCSAGSGPVDSCNECLTNQPSEACEWHLEDR